MHRIKSVVHQDEGGIGKSVPETQEISQGQSPREIARAERMDFPIPPKLWWSMDIFSSSIFLQWARRMDNAKINPSLLMMRDCQIKLVVQRNRSDILLKIVGHGQMNQHHSLVTKIHWHVLIKSLGRPPRQPAATVSYWLIVFCHRIPWKCVSNEEQWI